MYFKSEFLFTVMLAGGGGEIHNTVSQLRSDFIFDQASDICLILTHNENINSFTILLF